MLQFKAAYRKYKTYFLSSAVMKADGSDARFLLESGIYKNSIQFSRVDIGEHDPDLVVFRERLA